MFLSLFENVFFRHLIMTRVVANAYERRNLFRSIITIKLDIQLSLHLQPNAENANSYTGFKYPIIRLKLSTEIV